MDRTNDIGFPGPLRDPWDVIDELRWAEGLENELQKELSPEHKLYGKKATAIATRCDNDDVLFAFDDGSLAVVHLTWAKREETPPWPGHWPYPDALTCWKEHLQPEMEEWDEEE